MFLSSGGARILIEGRVKIYYVLKVSQNQTMTLCINSDSRSYMLINHNSVLVNKNYLKHNHRGKLTADIVLLYSILITWECLLWRVHMIR